VRRLSPTSAVISRSLAPSRTRRTSSCTLGCLLPVKWAAVALMDEHSASWVHERSAITQTCATKAEGGFDVEGRSLVQDQAALAEIAR
jgi:hypothetical protein